VRGAASSMIFIFFNIKAIILDIIFLKKKYFFDNFDNNKKNEKCQRLLERESSKTDLDPLELYYRKKNIYSLYHDEY
jgi:hypothetical protein